MSSNSQLQENKSISTERVANIFRKFFYSQPILIIELPAKELLVSIKNEQGVEISSEDKIQNSKEIKFQGEVDFYPFLLQTKQNTFIVIGSPFSLYAHISREPYLETKAEYLFQQKLRKALKLTGGYVYHLPGDSSDFVIDNIDLEDVISQDLELRYVP